MFLFGWFLMKRLDRFLDENQKRIEEAPECLIVISAHSDLCYVYIAIAHCDRSKVFLLSFFSACRELSDSTSLSRLRRLSTCIRVNFCIEYHYVDVFSTCKYVVNTTESDIVSPSVTTEDPLGFLSKEVFLFYDIFACRALASF